MHHAAAISVGKVDHAAFVRANVKAAFQIHGWGLRSSRVRRSARPGSLTDHGGWRFKPCPSRLWWCCGAQDLALSASPMAEFGCQNVGGSTGRVSGFVGAVRKAYLE